MSNHTVATHYRPSHQKNPSQHQKPHHPRKQVSHAKADPELAVDLFYKRTLHGKIRFLEKYKKIWDSGFGEETSIDGEMKASAYVEENPNAEGEKHTKKGKEERVKSEVHERFVIVEEREGFWGWPDRLRSCMRT